MTMAALAFMSLILASSSSVSVTVEAASRLLAVRPEAHDVLADLGKRLGRIDGKGRSQTRSRGRAPRKAPSMRKQGFHAHGFLSLVVVVFVVEGAGFRREPNASGLRHLASTKARLSRAPAAGSGQASSSLQIQPA